MQLSGLWRTPDHTPPPDALPAQPKARRSSRQRRRIWGLLPEIAATQCCALLFMAAVNTGGRFSFEPSEGLFWVGLALIFVPALLRMMLPDLSRRERIALVVVTGLSLYMVKILHSPASFTLHDELLHWKTVDAIMLTDRMFAENPLLPVSPSYPGLHLTTVALAEILGLSITTAGMLMLAIVRVVFGVALFGLMEHASSSQRVAGIGALIYMCNSNYIFFMAQFAYESLALPLALLMLLLVCRRGPLNHLARLVTNVSVIILVFSIIATHHLTSYMTIGFLAGTVAIVAVWPTVERLLRPLVDGFAQTPLYRHVVRRFIQPDDSPKRYGRLQMRQAFFWTLMLVATTSLIWLLYVATATLGYLVPVFSSAFEELLSIIRQENESRQLFASEGGNVRPLLERLTAVASVLLAVLAYPFGIVEIWRRHRDRTIALLLGLAATSYFVTLTFRFTEKGWELSNRSSEFLFVGIGFVTGLAIDGWLRSRTRRRLWIALFGFLGGVMFLGGLIAGWAYWARVPGPYMVGADTRSIDAEGLLAAGWTKQYLPRDSRIVADRINGLLMGSYGRLYVIRSGTDNIQIAPILFSNQLGDWERELMRITRAQYVVVDYRLTTELPELGVFVEVGEPGGMNHDQPLSRAAVEKFDLLPGVSRIYDAGNIILYDIESLTYAR
jgi:hypothetical protein